MNADTMRRHFENIWRILDETPGYDTATGSAIAVDVRRNFDTLHGIIIGDPFLDGLDTNINTTLTDLVDTVVSQFGEHLTPLREHIDVLKEEVLRRANIDGPAGMPGPIHAVAFLFSGLRYALMQFDKRGSPKRGESWFNWFKTGAELVLGSVLSGVWWGVRKVVAATRGAMEGAGALAAIAGVFTGGVINVGWSALKKVLPSYIFALGIPSGTEYSTFTELITAWKIAKGISSTEDALADLLSNIKYTPNKKILDLAGDMKKLAITHAATAARNHIAAGEEVAVALRHLMMANIRLEGARTLLTEAQRIAVDITKVEQANKIGALCEDFIQAYFEFIMTVNSLNITRGIAHRALEQSRNWLRAPLPGKPASAPTRMLSSFTTTNFSSRGGPNLSVPSASIQATAIALRPTYNLCVDVHRILSSIEPRRLANPNIPVLLAALPADPPLPAAAAAAAAAPAPVVLFPNTADAAILTVRTMQVAFFEFLESPVPGEEARNLTYVAAAKRARRNALNAAAAAAAAAAGGDEAGVDVTRADRLRRTAAAQGVNASGRTRELFDRLEAADLARRVANVMRTTDRLAAIFVGSPVPWGGSSAAAAAAAAGGAGQGGMVNAAPAAAAAARGASAAEAVYERLGPLPSEESLEGGAVAALMGLGAPAAAAAAGGFPPAAAAAGGFPPAAAAAGTGLALPPAAAPAAGFKRTATGNYTAAAAAARAAAAAAASGGSGTGNGGAGGNRAGEKIEEADSNLGGGAYRRRRTHRRRAHTHKRKHARNHRVKASRRRVGKSRKAGRR